MKSFISAKNSQKNNEFDINNLWSSHNSHSGNHVGIYFN